MASYRALLDRLYAARRFGVVLGLERMRGLLDRLGAPDRRLGRVIHVAGTNGKGSTVAMIARLAREAGARVATYTSPHLNALTERIAIDGVPIDGMAMATFADEVSAAGGDELTFFEQVTAIAMVAIAAAKVDVTVLEVGLGGRLDATNAIAADIAVITGVAMDHEGILGSTLEAIAAEKAGIIKRGQRVVIGASGEAAAVPVLVAAARALDIEPIVVDAARIAAVPVVALPGAHQRSNAAAALAAFAELPGYSLAAEGRAAALAAVVHPGRFEVLRDRSVDLNFPHVILDGAHNPHGAAALAQTLRDQQLTPSLVLAVSADKDVRGILRALLPVVGMVVATAYHDPRAMRPDALAQLVREESTTPRTVLVEGDVLRALQATTHGPILVAGSLFLVAEARQVLLGVPTDPIRATDPPAMQTP